MADDIAIRAVGVGKRYNIGTRQRYKALRDTLVDIAKLPFRAATGQLRAKEHFWALDDVSFEIRKGEAVGLIGRNGAGKSTLLKVLSRITEPSTGRIELHGRVGSLLEVGTGFHPELTGRENIFLNGAILGMKRHEIRTRFDAIVEFAEIAKFLDTPVKHYSSGMYTRLAFSVAAHLEPEILLVDEVLAVGDAAFQKKCLGKMSDVAHDGRTVVFVSHNMPAIKALCSRVVLLAKSTVEYDGPAEAGIAEYLGMGNSQYYFAPDEAQRCKQKIVELTEIFIDLGDKPPKTFFTYEDEIVIRVRMKVFEQHSDLVLGLIFTNPEGLSILKTYVNDCRGGQRLVAGEYDFELRIEAGLLAKGRYTIDYGSFLHGSSRQLEAYESTMTFEIASADSHFSSRNGSPGIIALQIPWIDQSENRET